MIVTCPECAARFSAKDEAFLPSGRRVRCAKCGHAWFQGPPGSSETAAVEAPAAPAPVRPVVPDPVPEPAPEPELPAPAMRTAHAAIAEDFPAEFARPAPAAIPAAAPRKRARSGTIMVAAGWVLLLATIGGVGWAAVKFRQPIANAWPRTASAYAKLGLPVNTSGLAFEDVLYNRQSEDSQTVLAVTGTLVNASLRSQNVPEVRVILSTADGRELYRWQFKPPVATLRARQHVPFKTRLSNPPDAARHLTLEFVAPPGE